MTAREQVADLREGDVVEFRIDDWPKSHAIRATLQINDLGALVVPIPGDDQGGYWIRTPQGQAFDGENRTLTVVSRAPRPLYVNHDRTEPEFGDTARNGGFDESDRVYWRADGFWLCNDAGRYDDDQMPARLRLLVDGTTGQVVP